MTTSALVNLAFQMGNNPGLLAHTCAEADVGFVVEALADGGRAPAPLADLLPADWATNQDTSSAAKAGSAVCWNTETIELVKVLPLVQLSPMVAGKVRARYLSAVLLREKATGDVRPYAAWHAPLLTTGKQALFYRNLSGWLDRHPRAVAGGDGNRRPAKVAELVGRRVVGTEVMALILPADLEAKAPVYDRRMSAWTDHPIVRARLTPKPGAIRPPKEAPVPSKVQIYPGADAKAQWFADDYPGRRFDANCGVIHTTETTGWPPYGGGKSAPNVTARPDFAGKRLAFRQHFPVDMSSRALKNLAGGVETNALNVVQLELVGTCDPKHRKSWNGEGKVLAGRDYIYWPDAPDWALRDLAAFLAWCEKEHGIPLTGVEEWVSYPASYGQRATQRLTHEEWRAFKGWCGHQHVPENDHGDPGSLKFARVLELVGRPAPVAPKPAPLPETELSRTRAQLAAWRKRLGTTRPRVTAAIDAFLKGTPKR